MKLWVAKVQTMNGGRCAVCGKLHGEIDPVTGKPSFMNAHHVESRDTCPRLRWDPLNGVLLCPSHHKFGKSSAHKSSIWFITWLQQTRPLQYAYIMAHRSETIDIDDRDLLARIETGLKAPPTVEELAIIGKKVTPS